MNSYNKRKPGEGPAGPHFYRVSLRGPSG